MKSLRRSWNTRQSWTDVNKETKLTTAETGMEALARLAEAEVELDAASVFHHAGCLDIAGRHIRALDRQITQPNTRLDANVFNKKSVRIPTPSIVCVSSGTVSCRLHKIQSLSVADFEVFGWYARE